MNDFKVTLWLHTSMTREELINSIEEAMPTASYRVEDLCEIRDERDEAKIRPTINLGPGMETVDVRGSYL